MDRQMSSVIPFLAIHRRTTSSVTYLLHACDRTGLRPEKTQRGANRRTVNKWLLYVIRYALQLEPRANGVPIALMGLQGLCTIKLTKEGTSPRRQIIC